MEFKGKGEINRLSLVEKASSTGEGIQELSLDLHFITDQNPSLLGMSEDQLYKMLEDDEIKEFSKGKGSEILSEVFNININGFVFKGEGFSSCQVRKQEKTGYVTALKCRIGFNQDFYIGAPSFFKKVIDIEILSVQGTIEQPEE